jgi:histidinol dehydrogenase (EC 1.1.1.23)
MSFNTIIDWNTCSDAQQRELLMRPAISASESITRTVAEILDNVKARGDDALREYSAKFDKTEVDALQVTAQEIAGAESRLGDEIKQAMAVAVKNIDTFHTAQKLQAVDVETLPGVRCQQVTRPVASVGLYIPGGSAPLFSTVLMLATPARIAGCQMWCSALRHRSPMRSCMRRSCAACRRSIKWAVRRRFPPGVRDGVCSQSRQNLWPG